MEENMPKRDEAHVKSQLSTAHPGADRAGRKKIAGRDIAVTFRISDFQ